MPNLDSITTISTLQQINPQVPIILMSGLASNDLMDKVSSTNSEAFLAKPFTTWELLNTLKMLKLGTIKYPKNAQSSIQSKIII